MKLINDSWQAAIRAGAGWAAVMTAMMAMMAAVPQAHAQSVPPQALYERLNALAPAGHADVLYNLGMFLNNGIGTARDNPAAFRHFVAAAERGHALAAYKVGCYYAGQFAGVVPKDAKQALEFKLRAAQAGYSLAQWDVAQHYAQAGDFLRAALWWERASRQGETPATVFLAHHLINRGGPQDQAKALALMQWVKARESKVPASFEEQLAKLQSTLSAQEHAQAEQIRADWVTGPTALTLLASSGLAAVTGLLASLEHVQPQPEPQPQR